MPRCLITGASGFIGANLVAHMENAGWDVRCLIRPTSDIDLLSTRKAERVFGSLADQSSLNRAVSGMDTVFHLAGRVRALREKDFQQDNVLGTDNVAKACAHQPQPPVMVYVSSLAAGGPGTKSQPRVETDPDSPVSNYGRSKLAAEKTLASWSSQVPVSIVRPPIVFGPGDREGLKLFLSVKRFRLHLTPGSHRFHVSVVYIDDLCEALSQVAAAGCRISSYRMADHEKYTSWESGTYYVTSETALDYGEMGRMAAQSLDVRALVLPLPKVAFWVVGAAMEGLNQLDRNPRYLNLDKMREATAVGWVCSDKKIRDQLNFRPTANLNQQFADTASWYLAHRWL